MFLSVDDYDDSNDACEDNVEGVVHETHGLEPLVAASRKNEQFKRLERALIQCGRQEMKHQAQYWEFINFLKQLTYSDEGLPLLKCVEIATWMDQFLSGFRPWVYPQLQKHYTPSITNWIETLARGTDVHADVMEAVSLLLQVLKRFLMPEKKRYLGTPAR